MRKKRTKAPPKSPDRTPPSGASRIMRFLREELAARGMSAYRLGRLTGIAPTQIYQTLKSNPNVLTVERLCAALDVTTIKLD